MITSELISYIKSQLDAGMTEMQIGTILKANGWIEADIHEAFSTIYPAPVQVAPVIQQVPEIIQMTEPMYAESFKPIEYTRPQLEPVQPIQTFEPVQVQPAQPIQMTQPAQVIQPEPIMMQSQSVVNPVVIQPIVETMPLMQAQTMPSMQAQVPYQQPAQQNIYMQQPMQQVQPTSSRAKKFILPIIVLILLLAASGGVYAYFTGYFTPLEKTTAQALESMYSAKSASFDITTTVDLSGAGKSTTDGLAMLSGGVPVNKVSITAKGMYDLSDVNNEKISTTISVGAGSMNVDAELRYLDKTVYAQLIKIPAATLIPNLASFTNQWIALPSDGNTDGLSDTPFASLPGIDSKIFSSLTTEQKAHLYDLARNSHFITVTKKESPESINGKLAYHFYFDLDKKGIAEYLKQVESYIHEIGKNDSKLSSFDVSSGIKQLDSIQDFVGEAWIGKTDKLLAKTNINFSVVSMNNNEQSIIKVAVIGIFDKWNEPVTVAVPESSKTIEDIMKDMAADIMDGTSSDPLIQASLDAADAKAEVAKLKSMVSNARASAELYYDKSKSYSGFCDSKEYQKASEITCASSKSGFFAITPLQGGRFYCADATGFSGEVSAKPTSGTVCPKK